jgi:hypothetical protein
VLAQEQGASTHQNGAGAKPENESEKALVEYTFWLMLFTGVLALATVGLGSATVGLYFTGQQQIDIVREEFAATHRPRLRIRNFAIANQTTAGRFFGRGFDCAWTVDNIGGSGAFIVQSHVVFFLDTARRLPMISPADPAFYPNNFAHGDLANGQSRVFSFRLPSPLATARDADRVFDGVLFLYFIGWIEYRALGQEHGVIHRTAFCRLYDYNERRFMPIGDDQDYEYET